MWQFLFFFLIGPLVGTFSDYTQLYNLLNGDISRADLNKPNLALLISRLLICRGNKVSVKNVKALGFENRSEIWIAHRQIVSY